MAFRTTVPFSLVLIAALAPAISAAQEADPKPKTRSRLLEEVVVTAQKREENVKDIPISIAAYSGDQLDALGIETPKDLQLEVPGLQYNIVAGYSLIYIRGVGTGAFIPSADFSVATYIDNIYYPFSHGLATALGTVERVEVLKGPQGTLFGRNSTGGAISIHTKDPSPEQIEANVKIDYGNYDKRNYRAYLNLPVTDTLSVAVSGLDYTQESYYELTEASPRKKLREDTSQGYKVKLLWSPTANFDALLDYSYIETGGSTVMLFPAVSPKPLGAILGTTESPAYKTSIDADPYTENTTEVISGDFNYRMDWFDSRLLVSKQKLEAPSRVDYDGSSAPLGAFDALGQFSDVKTAEFQLISNDTSWGAAWLKWIAGIYYLESSAGYDPLLFPLAPNAVDYINNTLPGGPLADLVGRLTALPVLGPILDIANNGINAQFNGVLDTESISYFTQTTADITSWFSLTLGGRYQEETRSSVKSTFGVRLDPTDASSYQQVFDFGQQTETSSNFSPKVVFDFKLFDDDIIYLSWAKGFKSGTYNIIALSEAAEYVVPEETTTFELGYKGYLLDGSLNLNAAIFQNEIDDLQVQIISLTSGGAARFENAGKARIRGAETDFTWMLFPKSANSLAFTGALTYLDGEYTEYKNASGFDLNTGLYRDGAFNYTGNVTENTPEFTANLGLNYLIPMGDGTLELAGNVYHNAGFFFKAQNLKTSEEEAYQVVGARVSYHYQPWDVRITAYGKNITDEKYHTSINEYDFSTAALLASPATYGLRVNWNY